VPARGPIGAAASTLRRWTPPWRRRALESRLVWILGSPRSGSSWLHSLLAAADGTVAIDEPTVGLHLGVLTMDYAGVQPARVPESRVRVNELRADLDSYFFSNRYAPVWRPLLRRLLLGRLDAEVRDLAARERVRDPLVLIKEPTGSQGADIILSATPRSRMIFLLRDGRDVLDSELDSFSRGGWIADQIPDFALSPDDRREFLNARAHAWLYRTRVVQHAFADHPPELRFLVRYEDLLDDTEGIVGELSGWLGLGRSVEEVAGVVDALAFERINADDRGRGQFARAAKPGLWRRNLSPAEQDLIAGIIGPKLEELGYP